MQHAHNTGLISSDNILDRLHLSNMKRATFKAFCILNQNPKSRFKVDHTTPRWRCINEDDHRVVSCSPNDDFGRPKTPFRVTFRGHSERFVKTGLSKYTWVADAWCVLVTKHRRIDRRHRNERRGSVIRAHRCDSLQTALGKAVEYSSCTSAYTHPNHYLVSTARR